MSVRRYQICVFRNAETNEREVWSHYIPRNCNTEWPGYMGTFAIHAVSARDAGKQAIKIAKGMFALGQLMPGVTTTQLDSETEVSGG